MNSLEAFVLCISWGAAVAVAVLVLAMSYVVLRLFIDFLIKRGLFPVALAPALIIAARLRVTKVEKSRMTAHIVLREIVRAEKSCPGFTAHLEELFPRRHGLSD